MICRKSENSKTGAGAAGMDGLQIVASQVLKYHTHQLGRKFVQISKRRLGNRTAKPCDSIPEHVSAAVEATIVEHSPIFGWCYSDQP